VCEEILILQSTESLCAADGRYKDGKGSERIRKRHPQAYMYDDADNVYNRVKRLLRKNQFIFDKVQTIVRSRRYSRLKKEIPFYPYYLAQRKKHCLPDL